MKKRFVSLLLAISMIFSLMPVSAVTAFAEDENSGAVKIIDKGNCGADEGGENLKWTLDNNGVLTISGSGAMKDYTWDENVRLDWYVNHKKDIRSVVLDNRITHIGDYAFDKCTNIESVRYTGYTGNAGVALPESVTTIGVHAFSDTGVTGTLKLPEHLTEIDSSAFYHCRKLNGELKLPDTVKEIGGFAFHSCGFTGKLELPASLENIGNDAFDFCSGLTGKLTFPSKMNEIDFSIFQGTGITEVVIPSSIETVRDFAFKSCMNLKKVYLPTKMPTIYNRAFINCSDVKFYYPAYKADWMTQTSKFFDSTLNTDIEDGGDSKTFKVNKYVNAEVTITDLDHTTVKAGEAKDFTVSVTPNDDANTGAKATITVSGANADAVEKIQYKVGETWKDVPGEGLSIDEINNTEFKLITKADANDGDVTITVTAKKANGTEIDKKVAAVTVTKKEEPATPGGGSTGGGENPGENPGDSGNTGDKDPETKSYELTVIGGSFTAKQGENALDVETAGENNTLTAKIPAGAVVTVTLNKAAVPEGMNFDQWRINDDTLMGNPDVAYNQESFHFTMPDHDVKVEVMYKDATIESDGPGILGTGALIATGVVGSAALLYQGHMLGTELYLRYLLPHGAVIPQNRAELAVLLWQDAENPEPVSTTLYSDISEDDSAIQQAARWAVENDLMEQLDAEEHPDHFDPFVPVTFSDSIRAWKKAQELKK